MSSALAGIINGATPLLTLVAILLAFPEEKPTRQRIDRPGDRLHRRARRRGRLAGPGRHHLAGHRRLPARRRRLRHLVPVRAPAPRHQLELGAADDLRHRADDHGDAADHAGDAADRLLARPDRASVVLAMLALGVLGSGLAYILNFVVIARSDATTASTVTYVITLVAVVSGALVLGEHITWNQPVGALLVVARGRDRPGPADSRDSPEGDSSGRMSGPWPPPRRPTPTSSSSAPAPPARPPPPGRPAPGSTSRWSTPRCSRATSRAATASPRGPSPSSTSWACRPGSRAAPATGACARRASARSSTCPGRAARCPATAGAAPRLELDAAIRQVALDAGRHARSRGIGPSTSGSRAGRCAASSSRPAPAAPPSGARSPAAGWSWPTAPSPSSAACSAARGTAAPPTAWPRGRTSSPTAATTRGSRRTSSCAARTTSCCRATAGSSRSATARSTSASARWPPTSTRPTSTCAACSSHYAESQRETWQLEGDVRAPWSALLPMGGAVSGVAGPNWLLVGDAAGCVNPLNGEGIDYGLETGHLAAQLLAGTIPNAHLDYTPAVGAAAAPPATARRSRSPGGWPGCLTVPGPAADPRPGGHAVARRS